MPLKKIIFNKKIYKQDKPTNSYICNCGNICSLLVSLIPVENRKGYTDIKIVSNNFKTHGDDSDFFVEYDISYDFYVAGQLFHNSRLSAPRSGIQYVEYIPCNRDAGENFLAFNMKKFLQIHEPTLYDEIMEIHKLINTNNTIVWK